MNANVQGLTVAIRGPVLDIRFAIGRLPAIGDEVAVEIGDGAISLAAEVQQHLDASTVRCVALYGTAGLHRGAPVRALSPTIRAPSDEVLLDCWLQDR